MTNTGYARTYADFQNYVTYALGHSNKPIELYGYEFQPAGHDFKVFDKQGKEVDPKAAYDAIQADRQSRYSFHEQKNLDT
ncbi:unnamed protein product [Didymodactylos carnosus]|uniref:Uncharacterized protein n=1 Tax=Didymodactylos carnosus TaxID=1234261 RepID=A0A816AQ25_9BILA|nr:unnamed protein product [Didymodactylos carnosus]CAF4473345.1 unnamed protein product [Didymodactylos carnosus]